jgi:putative photosynthetic complex assembly protein 2
MMTLETAIAVLAVLFAWWASTGLVLALVWLGAEARRVAFAASTFAALVGFFGTLVTSQLETPSAVWLGFVSALLVWGWHELAFLLGIVTGPNRAPCPPDARGLERFWLATLTVIHHEVALFVTLLAVVGLTWGAPNPVAPLTFAALWVMRLSSKLNLFFGVRNLADEFLPAHLRFLRTYFRQSVRNPVLVISILAGLGSVVAGVLLRDELARSGSQQLGLTVVITMLALGVLEHVFLAVPLGDAALWRWIIRSRAERSTALSTAAPPVRP